MKQFVLFIIVLSGTTNACKENESGTNPFDVAFLMDSSGSLSQKQFDEIKSSVAKIVQGLGVGPDGVRVALVTFSRTAKVNFWLDETKIKEGVVKALEGITMIREYDGNTHIGLALIREKIFNKANGARCNLPRAVVLLTDAPPRNTLEARKQATFLRQCGAQIFVIGAGVIRKKDLLGMDSLTGDKSHIYKIGDEDQVRVKLQSMMLKGADRQTDYTPAMYKKA